MLSAYFEFIKTICSLIGFSWVLWNFVFRGIKPIEWLFIKKHFKVSYSDFKKLNDSQVRYFFDLIRKEKDEMGDKILAKIKNENGLEDR